MALPFTPTTAADMSIIALWAVFGDVIEKLLTLMGVADAADIVKFAQQYDLLNENSSTMPFTLAQIIGVYNSGVLVFGAILMLYTSIFSVVNTANDGEAMGKRWSSFYTPLRTLTAGAMLIPTSLGYSGIQILLIGVVLLSVGLANTTWNTFVEKTIASSVGDILKTGLRKNAVGEEMVDAMVTMRVCGAAMDYAMNATLPEGAKLPTATTLRVSNLPPEIDGTRTTYITKLSMKNDSILNSESICGAVTLKSSFTITSDTAAKALSSGNAATVNPYNPKLGDLESFAAAIAVSKMKSLEAFFGINGQTASSQSIDGIVAKLINVSTTSGATYSASDYSATKKALAKALSDEIVKAVEDGITKKSASFSKGLTNGGWALAGGVHRQLSTIKEKIKEGVDVEGAFSYTPPSWNVSELVGNNKSIADVMGGLIEPYRVATETVVAKSNASGTGATANYAISGASTTSGSYCGVVFSAPSFSANTFSDGFDMRGWLSRTVSSFGEGIVSTIVSQLGQGGKDPIMQVKDAGDCLITTVQAVSFGMKIVEAMVKTSRDVALAAVTAASAAGGAIPGAGAVAGGIAAAAYGIVTAVFNLLSAFLPAFEWSSNWLLFVGYWMAYLMPMIPFAVFTAAVIGWLIGVVEAMIAAPLWVVMHMTPGQDSFIGSQGQGYTLVASLFMRPVILVLGLGVSMMMTYPAIWILNKGFIAAMGAIQVNSTTGLFGIAAFLTIYAGLVTKVLWYCFTLPNVVADAVFRWIGANTHSFGSSELASNVAGNPGGGGLGSGADGIRRNVDSAEAKKASAANSAAANQSAENRHREMMGAIGGRGAAASSQAEGAAGIQGQGGNSTINNNPDAKKNLGDVGRGGGAEGQGGGGQSQQAGGTQGQGGGSQSQQAGGTQGQGGGSQSQQAGGTQGQGGGGQSQQAGGTEGQGGGSQSQQAGGTEGQGGGGQSQQAGGLQASRNKDGSAVTASQIGGEAGRKSHWQQMGMKDKAAYVGASFLNNLGGGKMQERFNASMNKQMAQGKGAMNPAGMSGFNAYFAQNHASSAVKAGNNFQVYEQAKPQQSAEQGGGNAAAGSKVEGQSGSKPVAPQGGDGGDKK